MSDTPCHATYRRAIGTMLGLVLHLQGAPLRRASPYRQGSVRMRVGGGLVAKKGKLKIVPIARRYVVWPGVCWARAGPSAGWEMRSLLVYTTPCPGGLQSWGSTPFGVYTPEGLSRKAAQKESLCAAYPYWQHIRTPCVLSSRINNSA